MTDREKMMLAALEAVDALIGGWDCSEALLVEEAIAAVRENPTPSEELVTRMRAWLSARGMTHQQAFASVEYAREVLRVAEELEDKSNG